jgi:hypothetical protein
LNPLPIVVSTPIQRLYPLPVVVGCRDGRADEITFWQGLSDEQG